ncbi:MAG: ABC transporter substrate-binding protein [Patescibacteria group bacterium]
MKYIAWIIVIALVIWALVSWSGKDSTPPTPTSSEPIKIGVVAPLTGGAAAYGVSLVKSIELAHNDLGNNKSKYILVVEDDASNPAQAATAAQKLANVDKVQAIITVTSGTGNSVKPIATGAQIPHVCICSDVTIADNEFNFINSILPDEEATAWLKEASSRGVKTVAILSQNQAGFNLLTDNVKKEAVNNGITIVYDERFDPTIRDFKTGISKAKLKNPDLYLAGFFPPQLDIIGQELKNLGITKVAGMATLSISATPEVFNGAWYSDSSLGDTAFRDRFNTQFPETRFNVRVAPNGYDSFNLLTKGFESGSVIDYLTNVTEYRGAAGSSVKNKGKRIFHSPIGIWEIKNGEPVQVK